MAEPAPSRQAARRSRTKEDERMVAVSQLRSRCELQQKAAVCQACPTFESPTARLAPA